jgi:hypothetical protein
MEAKGSAVISIKEFVKKKHPNQYEEWKANLEPATKEIFSNLISAGQWYPLEESVIKPTKKAGEAFFSKDLKKAAWEMGRFSAEMGLSGMYKVFVLIAKPTYIMGRASKVFSTYYQPIKLEIVSKSDKHVTLHMTNCAKPSDVLEWRIAGWCEKALEICGCKNLKVDMPKSLFRKDAYTEFAFSWD